MIAAIFLRLNKQNVKITTDHDIQQIESFSEIKVLLEESLFEIQKMIASPYSGPMKQEILKHYNKVQNIFEIVQEWEKG